MKFLKKIHEIRRGTTREVEGKKKRGKGREDKKE
jgi:hypothetical protein